MPKCIFDRIVKENGHKQKKHKSALLNTSHTTEISGYTKAILGPKTCQEFHLVKILCDDQYHCKTVNYLR